MQIKYVAIDDEPLGLTLIREYASRIPTLSLVQTFTDAIAGAEYLRKNPIDLVFLDINMPDMLGVDLAKSLTVKPMVIFTTAHKKFAVDAFDLDAIDYLLKPIDFARFERAVKKATEFFHYKHSSRRNENKPLFVRSEYQLVKIELYEIEYIESLEDYLKIHLNSGKYIMTLMTLKAILEKLPPTLFKRIHRSYVVPLAKIRSVVNRRVRLTEIELPVSDRYADVLRDWKK
ncbi:MAG TPA: LytTR family DNA-binding domain-containing protein [Flavitalea sp.]|nr:LytTR family DNA-binding domain-containing protein [Flavitalea sp.]